MSALGKEVAMQASALGDDGVQTVRYWLYTPGHHASMWDDFYARGVRPSWCRLWTWVASPP